MTNTLSNNPADRFSELRRRAEAALASASSPETGDEPINDVRKLLSELQIHQIELEMQNEELRQAQIHLASEREKYADLYNFAPVAYFTVDRDDVILELNLAAAELLGHEPRYLARRPITPYLTPESLVTFVQHREKARALGRPQTCELTIRRRDGGQSIVQARTIALEHDAASRPLWRSVMTDITGQKRIEGALRESEERFRSIAEQSTDVIAITDQQGRILYVSHASSAMFGFPAEDMQGYSLIDFLDESSTPKDMADFQEAIARSHQSRSVELLMKRKDGSTFHCEVSGTYYSFDSHPGMLLIIHDISERKRAGDELQKSEKRYRDLFTNNHAIMLLIDPETGQVVDANSRALAFYGYTGEELKNMYISDINTLTREQISQAMQKVTFREQQHFFFQHRLRSGEIKDVEVYSAPIDLDGKNLFYSIVHDITEKKRAEQITQLRFELLEFAASHSMDELLTKALNEIEEITNSSISFYHFVEADNKTLSLQSWSSRTSTVFCKVTDKGMHYPIDQAGVWVDCIHQRKPIIHNDYASLGHRKGMPEGHAQVVRELVVPILRDGRVVSVLGIGNKPTDYHEGDIEIVTFIADVTWEIVQRKRAEEALTKANEQLSRQLVAIKHLQAELKEQTLRDPLTGLYNRRYLAETITREMARSRRQDEALSVIIMDVDRFKKVNDKYGHQVGDQFLQMIATLIDRETRDSDIACRYGGEEFLLLMPGTDIESAGRRAEELRVKCAAAVVLNEEKHLTVTLSFGVASYPLHGSTPDEILSKADRALYQSKRTGRNRVTLWSEEKD